MCIACGFPKVRRPRCGGVRCEGCCSRSVPTMMCTGVMVWRPDTRDIITPVRSTTLWTKPRLTPSWGSVLSESRAVSTSQDLFKTPVRWQTSNKEFLTVMMFRVDIPWLCRGHVRARLRLWHRPPGRGRHRPAGLREAGRRGGQHLLLQQPEL